MSQSIPSDQHRPHNLGASLAALRDMGPWIIAFGAVSVALGGMAFASVFAATIITVYFVGIGMIAAGLAEVIIAFRAKSWSRFFFWMILGALYTMAGMFTFMNPLLAAGVLTLVLGSCLIAIGLLRIFLAFQMRTGSAWFWVALSGAVTTFLGAMIVQQWPVSSLYILGIFLSMDLLFSGLGWINLGFMLWRRKRSSAA